jgi:hypothetical protein
MSRILAVIGTAIALVIGGLAAFAAPAFAGTGNQYFIETTPFSYANAWNGGPWIEVYNNTAVNNDFTAGQVNGYYYIEDTGTHNSWYGMCMGDAYNNPSNLQVSLDPCPTPGHSGGWGTHFTVGLCTLPGGLHGLDFKNNHTGYYLEPEGSSNGTKFDLLGSVHSQDPTCFNISLPA